MSVKIICTVSEFADIVRGCNDVRRLGRCSPDYCPLYEVCSCFDGKIEQFVAATGIVEEGGSE